MDLPNMEPVVTQTDLAEWYRIKTEMAKLKPQESLLRSKIFKFFFPAWKEGTNHAENDALLQATHKITAVCPITRDVDEGTLEALSGKLFDAGIDLTKLLKYKPELNVKQYRTLSDEQRALVDQFLIIKPGSPQVTIKPKTAKD